VNPAATPNWASVIGVWAGLTLNGTVVPRDELARHAAGVGGVFSYTAPANSLTVVTVPGRPA
jgi:hypothetical protein